MKKKAIKARAILAIMLLFMAAFFSARVNLRANAIASAYLSLDEFIPAASAAEEIPAENVILTHYAASLQQVRPIFTPPSEEDIARISDFNYLTRNIFLTDPGTRLLETDINVAEALATEFHVDTTAEGPQILIFHAHSMEMFADSDPADPMTGVMGVGRHLAEILETQHGVEVKHYMGRFDMVSGIPYRPGSYERMEPVIRRILAENPSIQMVIDLHRDGVGPHVAPMVTYINGERAAQIMFVNGLSRRFRNGTTTTVYHLPNPYQRENLAFTLNLQLAANNLYPGIARRAYLLPFRYSLHMAPQSILLEVGAQNNTFQEALNAMEPMANIIAAVVLGEAEASGS